MLIYKVVTEIDGSRFPEYFADKKKAKAYAEKEAEELRYCKEWSVAIFKYEDVGEYGEFENTGCIFVQ